MMARVISPWAGDGSFTDSRGYHPLLLDYYSVTRMTDVTGTPNSEIIPSVNLVVIEIECDAATLAAIEADARFAVVWWE